MPWRQWLRSGPAAWRESQRSQFSTESPSIRENSRSSSVTRVRRKAKA
jgi:hypothetical protein